MSPFSTLPFMPVKPFIRRFAYFGVFYPLLATLLLNGCSTPGQQLADAEITALNKANVEQNPNAQAPYLGSYGPNEPPRLSNNLGSFDQFNPELSDSVAVPFLSFLIIEPDPVTKNAVPSDVERLVKAKKYPEAIELIDKFAMSGHAFKLKCGNGKRQKKHSLKLPSNFLSYLSLITI
jgi:hypothetical protein